MVIVATAALSALIVVLTAWTGNGPRPALGGGRVGGGRHLATGSPTPINVARVGALAIKLPIVLANVTAIAYHATPGVAALSPEGKQVNEGLLARLFDRFTGASNGGINYYELAGGVGTSNGALDVGAPVGADVYAPVDGTVVQIGKYVIDGRSYGGRIDIRPVDDPTLIVSVTRLAPDHLLKIGEPLVADATRLGSVIDLSHVERLVMAKYSHDAGNHVTIEVSSAAIPILP